MGSCIVTVKIGLGGFKYLQFFLLLSNNRMVKDTKLSTTKEIKERGGSGPKILRDIKAGVGSHLLEEEIFVGETLVDVLHEYGH